MATVQVQKVNWWHERLADWMIMNPHKSLKDAAKVFNCSQAHISIIKNSDSFREYWCMRTNQASERNDANTLLAKTAALADIALDGLLEKVGREADTMQVPQLLDIANTALRRIGDRAPTASAPGSAPSVQVNIGIASPSQLAAAREKLKRLHGVSTSPPLETKAIEVMDGNPSEYAVEATIIESSPGELSKAEERTSSFPRSVPTPPELD